MGVVYLAEQEEPIARQVAVKIIKLGMDTRAVLARFQSEQQALALMEHPNIAQVYEAGLSDNGRPFPRCKTTVYDSGIKTPWIVRWPGRVA